MTSVIQSQIHRGIYISDHMLGRAVDIHVDNINEHKKSILRRLARQYGGNYIYEDNPHHSHIEF